MYKINLYLSIFIKVYYIPKFNKNSMCWQIFVKNEGHVLSMIIIIIFAITSNQQAIYKH